jgi:2-polyprenyl-3-methyl-5-hydroxy-6-metoxy-1,4-benzoquinol methylase
MMSSQIAPILKELGLASINTSNIYAQRTRGNSSLNVYRDCISGVIYIAEEQDHLDKYQSGDYPENNTCVLKRTVNETALNQGEIDLKRCLYDFEYYFKDKVICDVDCGLGGFLLAAKHQANALYGVELQEDCVHDLTQKRVACATTITDIDMMFDTVFIFHSFEHMNEPMNMLRQIKGRLKPGEHLIIEVPHANDRLLGETPNSAFKAFTLWSQHLTLHTHESIKKMLRGVGFDSVNIQGYQRYGLENHLGWYINGQPGGIKQVALRWVLCKLEKPYQKYLQKNNQTDTLITIVKQGSSRLTM